MSHSCTVTTYTGSKLSGLSVTDYYLNKEMQTKLARKWFVAIGLTRSTMFKVAMPS